MVQVTLRCGCRVQWRETNGPPKCQAHGEMRVTHVQAPAPRIRAVNCAATGPLVEAKP